MKLLIAIVNNEDASLVISELNKAGFMVTKLATSGGFLRAGNVTMLTGVEDEKVGDALAVIEEFSSQRKQITPVNSLWWMSSSSIRYDGRHFFIRREL